EDIQAKLDADYQLAERMQAEEQQELNEEEKAKFFMELLEKRKKFFAAKRAEEKRNRPPNKAQQRSLMCIYLKNIDGWKPRALKNKSFAEIQELFDKAMKRINTFFDFKTELVKESTKKDKAETYKVSVAATNVTIDDITLAKAFKDLKTSKPKIRGIVIKDHEETSKSRTTTKISSKKSQDKGVNTPQSGEDILKLNELMDLCTSLQNRVLALEAIKTSQAQEIDSLKSRVKKLNKKQRSRTHKLKRLYKVGLSARVESSKEEGLGEEDASKQGRIIDDLDADEDITFVNDQEMFDADKDLQGDEAVVEQEVVADK
nr:hypothetical protein [Tanacetum cinerariifolium]